MKKYFLAMVVVLVLISSFAINASLSPNAGNKVRVVAHTDNEINVAVAKGCSVVRDAKTVKALVCSLAVASELGLQDDIRVFAMDDKTNVQIGANLVHATNTGASRKIVVLDTGYNYAHVELSSSYLGGKDFVNNDVDPLDDNGHGTHVAGIITADGIDAKAKGVSPNAGIIAGKVLDASGSGFFSDVVAAIYWAVDGPDGVAGNADDFNADAISLSLGTSPPYTYKSFCDNVLPDLTTAINYARSQNVLVVVAAGNSGNSGVSLPGCISKSTTVGAVDSIDKIASFSGRGKAVDLSAPGVGIYSTWLGNGYLSASGTSMATPVVSGVVALIKFAHPNYTADQVENALFTTAKDLGKPGKDANYGWGRVNAQNAVK